MPVQRSIYLLLGSNLNRPIRQLEKARGFIEEYIGKIKATSSIYRTSPWGLSRQPVFYNQVIRLYSAIKGIKILQLLQEVEKRMGRIPSVKWGPRIIDIDILYIGYQSIKMKKLVVPHPRIHERRFVLAPLNDLIPAFRHPKTGKTIHQLFVNCTDPLFVKKIRE
ncbi:MAG: 2-amino-4-hydroxy-6-hydroxymethyldihydropteridine diphosphokinase [Saprospiraceae bacterium]